MDGELREQLWLVKHGVPFDVAFSLDRTERMAWSVIMGEFEGGTFNWSSGTWDRR